jgi:hypothetical protein
VFFSRLWLDVPTGLFLHGFSTKILYTLCPIIVLGGWIFTGKSELLRQNPVSFLICPQHISHGLSWRGTWACVLSGFTGQITIFAYTSMCRLHVSALLYHHHTSAIIIQEKEEAYQCISVRVRCYIAGDVLMC